jgi:epoxyqueuosine reductase QueG
LSDSELRDGLSGSPMTRAGKAGLRRNIQIASANAARLTRISRSGDI